MRRAPSVQLHPRGTEWLTWMVFPWEQVSPHELSSMPWGNTQFYPSHLKEPSSRVYQIQQIEGRVYNSLQTVLGHGRLARPQWWCGYVAVFACAPLCSSGPKLHPPTFSSQGPSPALFTFCCFLLCTFILQPGTFHGPTQSHPTFPESVVLHHPRFVNLSMDSCKFCFLGLLEYLWNFLFL